MMLDADGQRLLSLLVSMLPSANPGHPERMIGYKKAHELLGLKQVQADWGESLKAQGLDNLAQWTKQEGKPAITGLIVNSESLSPGAGYYRLFDRQNDDWDWWREQVLAAKSYDWRPHATHLADEPDDEPPVDPEAIDIQEPAGRVTVTVSRIIRDTAMARRVKRLHNYECQICGFALKLADGSRYAEAHHIQPLGGSHDGPDVRENIMCLCPNHHVEMDYGVFRLDPDMIRTVDGHRLAAKFIDYHNQQVWRGSEN